MRCRGTFCRAEAGLNPRKAGFRGGLCRKCQQRSLKHSNPLAYAYRFHLNSARRRGIAWLLTLEQFRTFWEVNHPEAWALKVARMQSKDTNKMRHKAAEILEMDRVDPSKGYEPDNLRIATKRVNVQRMWECRSKPPTFEVTCREVVPVEDDGWECPF